jgi:hypothetical protein
MILGVYRRAHKKADWHLFSVAQSAEVAKQDKVSALEKLHKDGKAEGEVAILTFDTASWMPEVLKDKEVKEDDRLLYN